MRLRARVVSLVALSLSLALAAALMLVERAATRQARQQLTDQLRGRLNSWERMRALYLESLQSEALALAAEPGLARVLRSADRATLEDYLHYRREGAPRALLVEVYDAQGQRLGRSGDGPQEAAPSSPLLQRASEGQPWAAFEVRGQHRFLAAAAPLQRQGRRLEALVWLGLALDAPFLEKLQLDLGGGVHLLDASQAGPAGQSSLRSPLEDAAGWQWGWLEVEGDLQGLHQLIAQLRWQLAGLGLTGVVGCTLLSLPWIGRTARPIEEMERTRAQLAGVVSASLDGLLALDNDGRVVLASPSAAALLGVALERLPGSKLQSLLPEQVLGQLIAQPPGQGPLLQTCTWQRPEGRIEVLRTFLNDGSLISFRDVTSQDRQRSVFHRLLDQLGGWLAEAPTPLQQQRLCANLVVLAGARPAAGDPPVCSLGRWQPIWAEKMAAFGDIDWSTPVMPEQGHDRVAAPAWSLEVILLNLLDNAFRHGKAPVGVEIEGDLGGCWLSVRDSGEALLQLPDHSYPQGSQLKGPGLGLAVVRRLVDECDGRLEARPGGWRLWLPAAP